MKKLLILLFLLIGVPAFGVNVVVESLDCVNTNNENSSFSAKVLERAEFDSGIVLNTNDEIKGTVIKTVEAKRGKRAGYIVIQPEAIYREGTKLPIEDENLEAKVVGYSKTDWKQMGKNASLSAGLTVGSHFVPGLSQMFYFSKGLLTPSEDESRLTSGVKSVYENSPFAYLEKGQDLDIEKGDYLVLKFYHADIPVWKFIKRTK